MNESEILAGILLALGCRSGLRIWRQNTGAAKGADGRLIRFGVVGCADILGVLGPRGRFLAIEVKTATGRQRPEQVAFQRMVEAHGGLYILARSVESAVKAVEAALAAEVQHHG